MEKEIEGFKEKYIVVEDVYERIFVYIGYCPSAEINERNEVVLITEEFPNRWGVRDYEHVIPFDTDKEAQEFMNYAFGKA